MSEETSFVGNDIFAGSIWGPRMSCWVRSEIRRINKEDYLQSYYLCRMGKDVLSTPPSNCISLHFLD